MVGDSQTLNLLGNFFQLNLTAECGAQ